MATAQEIDRQLSRLFIPDVDGVSKSHYVNCKISFKVKLTIFILGGRLSLTEPSLARNSNSGTECKQCFQPCITIFLVPYFVQDKAYRMNEPCIGRALIINNVATEMPGSQVDVLALTQAFQLAGFEVRMEYNCNKEVRKIILQYGIKFIYSYSCLKCNTQFSYVTNN